MPLDSILYLVFIVAMFTQFAAALTYAEWATRHANHHRPPFRNVARMQHLEEREEPTPFRKAA